MEGLLLLLILLILIILPWFLYKSKAKKYTNLEEKCSILISRLLNDSIKSIEKSMTANNWTTSKKKVASIYKLISDSGMSMSPDEEAVITELKKSYEKIVRREYEKQEQVRIKERIREEQRAEKEIERELRRLEREQDAIQKALDKAMKSTKDHHSAEIERLEALLAEAEMNSQRAKSMAQLTKAGYVYVISNFGSFGEGVFKVGMTRRLEPMDRVKELGDASVPFPFDVHMMINCDDAPALESALHKELFLNRVNKVNLRKEFFKISLDKIVEVVRNNHGVVEYVASPEALEYVESKEMSDEDFAEILKSKTGKLDMEPVFE